MGPASQVRVPLARSVALEFPIAQGGRTDEMRPRPGPPPVSCDDRPGGRGWEETGDSSLVWELYFLLIG